MYARGMSVREIQSHLVELYAIDVSPDLISTVTDGVLETVAEWQNRPLEASYPASLRRALRVKIRDEGPVRKKGSSSRWAWLPTEPRRCLSYGSRTPRAQNSGSR
jgi:transposase-like protein